MRTDATSLEAAVDAALEKVRTLRGLPSPEVRRALRVDAGLSEQDVANVVGVSREAISRYERGMRTPRGDHLTAYVKVLRALAREA